jgi:hypothetical protein
MRKFREEPIGSIERIRNTAERMDLAPLLYGRF